MKKLLLVIIHVTAINVWAQQEPLVSQFAFNNIMINPAVSGSVDGLEVRAMHRLQWTQFPGGPRTTFISAHANRKVHGMGIGLLHDAASALYSTGGFANYAFHIKMGEKSTLGFGLGARIMHRRWQANETTVSNINDPVLLRAADGLTTADANFGFHFRRKNFVLGGSVMNLIQTEFNFNKDYTGTNGNRNKVAKDFRHYFLYSSYKFKVADNTHLEPVFFLRTIETLRPQFDLGVKAHFMNEQLMVGYQYRNNEGMSALSIGMVFDHRFVINYTYDFAMSSKFQHYSQGSHEISLGLNLYRNINYNDENVIVIPPPPSANSSK